MGCQEKRCAETARESVTIVGSGHANQVPSSPTAQRWLTLWTLVLTLAGACSPGGVGGDAPELDPRVIDARRPTHEGRAPGVQVESEASTHWGRLPTRYEAN